ncbi:hypothetical protein SEVIR_7G186450v4 [Setaria viridis]|uniref:Uncharacterized protein n=1 Tax=Setaria viridis TaxID=4556 RepID=A0A4U6TS06_SETVI|nr:hypothetical protein SEVIR_7G186450v2 [Setaria viridis]
MSRAPTGLRSSGARRLPPSGSRSRPWALVRSSGDAPAAGRSLFSFSTATARRVWTTARRTAGSAARNPAPLIVLAKYARLTYNATIVSAPLVCCLVRRLAGGRALGVRRFACKAGVQQRR